MGRNLLPKDAARLRVVALDLFQAKPNDFDLVVRDMTMPNMTGVQLAIELMKTRNDKVGRCCKYLI